MRKLVELEYKDKTVTVHLQSNGDAFTVKGLSSGWIDFEDEGEMVNSILDKLGRPERCLSFESDGESIAQMADVHIRMADN